MSCAFLIARHCRSGALSACSLKSDLEIMKTDEEIMNTAEKNLYEEFAIALNISPEEVVSYIHERIPS